MAVTWGHASIKEGGWAKGVGLLLFLFIWGKSRDCFDVWQTGALLIQCQENKER